MTNEKVIVNDIDSIVYYACEEAKKHFTEYALSQLTNLDPNLELFTEAYIKQIKSFDPTNDNDVLDPGILPMLAGMLANKFHIYYTTATRLMKKEELIKSDYRILNANKQNMIDYLISYGYTIENNQGTDTTEESSDVKTDENSEINVEKLTQLAKRAVGIISEDLLKTHEKDEVIAKVSKILGIFKTTADRIINHVELTQSDIRNINKNKYNIIDYIRNEELGSDDADEHPCLKDKGAEHVKYTTTHKYSNNYIRVYVFTDGKYVNTKIANVIKNMFDSESNFITANDENKLLKLINQLITANSKNNDYANMGFIYSTFKSASTIISIGVDSYYFDVKLINELFAHFNTIYPTLGPNISAAIKYFIITDWIIKAMEIDPQPTNEEDKIIYLPILGDYYNYKKRDEKSLGISRKKFSKRIRKFIRTLNSLLNYGLNYDEYNFDKLFNSTMLTK